MSKLTERVWYREPWPWIVMSGPAIVVVAAFVSAWIAWHHADDVVAEDYYKRGLAVNAEIGRTARADALQLNGRVRWDGVASGEAVRVRLRAGTEPTLETSLRIRLVHPGRAEFDRVAMLSRLPGEDAGYAQYVGNWQPAPPLPAGTHALWSVVVEGRDWRMDADDGIVGGDHGRLVAPEATAAVEIALPQPARHP